MNSIIEGIYVGDLVPMEKIKRYGKNEETNTASDLYKKFSKELSAINPELVTRFEEFLESQIEGSAAENKSVFVLGVKIGAKLMLEILG